MAIRTGPVSYTLPSLAGMSRYTKFYVFTSAEIFSMVFIGLSSLAMFGGHVLDGLGLSSAQNHSLSAASQRPQSFWSDCMGIWHRWLAI